MGQQNRNLSLEERDNLLQILQVRFTKYMERHQDLEWDKIKAKLLNNPDKLWSLYQMEASGGEPDVVGFASDSDYFVFFDCAKESPQGRRSICYDNKAMISRRANPPKNNALDMAKTMGIELLDETQYRQLQTLGPFDTKTSSWIVTPQKIRELGGALFCDYRYDTIFVYHNGADSYYAARGFRGSLRV